MLFLKDIPSQISLSLSFNLESFSQFMWPSQLNRFFWPQASLTDSWLILFVLQLQPDKKIDFCQRICHFVMDLILLEAFSNKPILGVNEHSSVIHRQMPQIFTAAMQKYKFPSLCTGNVNIQQSIIHAYYLKESVLLQRTF